MTLWMIGFMFTVGYCGIITAKLPYWKYIGALVMMVVVWPLILGAMLGDCDDETEQKDSAK